MMQLTTIFSILFFTTCIVALISGILVLLNNHKAPANLCFFAMVIAVNFWSIGLAFATSASNVVACEIWRRFSAIGWGSAYAIILHFIIIISGTGKLKKKWWFYFLLYLPAAISVFAFAIPSGINQKPYQLVQTEFGWVNVAGNSIWDWIFYVYYIGYTIAIFILLLRWGKKSSDINVKKQSRIIFLSFVFTFIIASFTDVLLNIYSAQLPQMAPIIMLIPIIAIYHTIKKYGFIIKKSVDKKGRYFNLIISIIFYMVLAFILSGLAEGDSELNFLNFDLFSIRGIITQAQMLIIIYLVLKENKPGFIAAIILNSYSLFGSTLFILRYKSLESLPGVVSYLSVFMITMLIASYKKKTAENIEEIDNQRKSLEESEKKLYHMAYYDALTDLPNKEMLTYHLNCTIGATKRNAGLIGVIFIDLDNFKYVNDTLGHSAGDELLKQMSNRLSLCLREEDSISRFGGDEFLMMVSNINSPENLQTITNRIMSVFKQPVLLQNIEYFISASAGVAVYPYDGEDSETLIKNADIAMYSAKTSGKNMCVYCTTDMKNDMMQKLKLTNSIYRALDRNEFSLNYQPQIKADTKEIIGFEALLRWRNNELGMIRPDVFIPIAEQTGLIRSIGLWVFKTACEQFKVFESIFAKDLCMSINLSLEQLKETNIADKMHKIITEVGVDPNKLQIEITESTAFNEDPFVLQRLKNIKNLGIAISIDDFGKGYSSMNRLKTFPIDLLKIDMDFVHGISSKSQKDRAIINSIIQIANNLNIEVVAEGVETEEQFLYLRENGCDIIQGYYFYKPMPARDIELLLKRD